MKNVVKIENILKNILKFLGILFVFIACIAFIRQCNNNLKKEITPNDVVQALQNAGFTNTYYEGGKVYIDSTGVYITNTNRTIELSQPFINFVYIEDYTKETDIAGILDAIMPLWDDDFDEHGVYIINEWGDCLFNDDYYSGDPSIVYNGKLYQVWGGEYISIYLKQ